MAMKFVEDDGGREVAGYKGTTGDCVTRAIAIATQLPYREVYTELNRLALQERPSKARRGRSSAREGVHRVTYEKFLKSLGWRWTPTMKLGQGCRVHLTDGELPSEGRLVVAVSRHLTCVVDGVVRDSHNPQRTSYWFNGDVLGKSWRYAGEVIVDVYEDGRIIQYAGRVPSELEAEEWERMRPLALRSAGRCVYGYYTKD